METDPLLRRLERDALVACALLTMAALVWRRGQPDFALAVGGGGLLAAISYRGIKGGIDAMVGRTGLEEAESGPPPRVWALVKFFTRYAILALAAYVMLARLRLHPVGVFVGASSLIMAAAVEAIRSARPPSRDDHPR